MSDPTDTATDDEGQAAATTSGIIFGTVTDTSGNALEDVTVTIIDASSSSVVAETETDANGDYNVSVPDNTYDVRAEQPGFEPAEQTGITVSGSNVEVNFSLSRRTYKVRGELEDPYGRGVLGRNVVASGTPRGVTGVVPDAPAGTGVFGRHAATSGKGYGVQGITSSYYTKFGTTGRPAGVKGVATGSSGAAHGVYAVSEADGAALRVDANNDSANGIQVNSSGYGIRVRSDNTGVNARCESDALRGVSFDGRGVTGKSYDTTGLGKGVQGVTFSNNGRAAGVFGIARTSSNESGPSKGVYGRCEYLFGTGVLGRATQGSSTTYGVRGETASPDGYGVYSGGRFRAVESVAESGGGNLDRHVAQIRNTMDNSTSDKPDILGLEYSNITDPSQNNSYISFMDPSGTIGNIQGTGNGDVEFTGTTADVAEFFPKRDPDREFADGEVVGVVGGEVVPLEADVDPDAVLVVSTAPLVTGNRPPGERDRQDDHLKLSLVGQVPVQVSGPVAHGDVLVSPPEDEGTARARQHAAGDDDPIVGMALDEGTGGQVLALVGGPTPAATTGQPSLAAVREELAAKDDRIEELTAEVEHLQTETERLRSEIESLREANDRLRAQNETVRDRLAAVEERIPSQEDLTTAPAGADD